MKRSRVVEITVAPKLERMPEITLRKNCFVSEPRIGEASGKIIGYSIALDGSDGRINCEIKVGCTIGKGGAVTTAGGAPTYCAAAYTGDDYQVFIGRRVVPTAFDLWSAMNRRLRRRMTTGSTSSFRLRPVTSLSAMLPCAMARQHRRRWSER